MYTKLVEAWMLLQISVLQAAARETFTWQKQGAG